MSPKKHKKNTLKLKQLKEELEINRLEAQDAVISINRCTQRLARLLELEAPLFVIQNECRLIQYRALRVEQLAEKIGE